MATFELILIQSFGEIYQKRAGSGPEQGQRNGQEGMAGEEDDGEDPGQKDLKTQGNRRDDEKNEQVYFPPRYNLLILQDQFNPLQDNTVDRILRNPHERNKQHDIFNVQASNPLTNLIPNLHY